MKREVKKSTRGAIIDGPGFGWRAKYVALQKNGMLSLNYTWTHGTTPKQLKHPVFGQNGRSGKWLDGGEEKKKT